MENVSSNTIEVFNPANEEKIGEVVATNIEGARDALTRAKTAQPRWEAAGLAHRCRIIKRFKDLLIDRADEICRLLSQENGKVLQESLQMELIPLIDLADYFANRAEKILSRKKIKLHLFKHRKSYIHYRPRGVVFVISPWNYPLSIPFGEVIMSLLAGNAVLLKPASLTPLIALKIHELFLDVGLEPDLFQVLPGPGKMASELIASGGINFVNFTGSVNIGRIVSRLCGEQLIPCTMELGGKDPAIVLPDADLDLVTGSLVWGAFANAGQTCASIERVYIHESIFDEIVQGVVERTKKLQLGDPLKDNVDMGPMTDPQQLKIVEEQVDQATADGARALTGGKRIQRAGYFYPPTVLVDVNHKMETIREETFGPTLPLMSYHDLDKAIELANDSEFGLSAYVYGRDAVEMRRVAERLEAGTVMINETLITHACPETPWGGIKTSGIGHVHSDAGLRELCVAYHVNDEVVSTPRWSPFWQPYSHRMYQTLVDATRTIKHSYTSKRTKGAVSMLKGVYGMFRDRSAQD